jgi:hypothetical protein
MAINVANKIRQAVDTVGRVAHAAVTADSDMAAERRAICQRCPLLGPGRRCMACGCFIDLKTKLPEERCPHDQW